MSKRSDSEFRQRIADGSWLKPEEVSRLQTDFEFNNSFPLDERLTDAAFWAYVEGGVRASKEALKKLRARALSLHKTVRELGSGEIQLLFHYSNDWNRHQLLEQLQITASSAAMAAAVLKKGRPKEEAGRRMMQSLRWIYEQGTGDKTKYTYTEESGYQGPLIGFSEHVFELLGKDIPNESIGNFLKEILKAEKEAKNKH